MSEELKKCPFCGGGNVDTSYKDTFSGDFRRGVYCADCCGGIYPYYDTEAEAIAAWNTRAELGSGTCEYIIEDNMNESEGMGDVWFRCTNCGTRYDYYADDWLLKMPHCPKCGATVKGVR